MQGVTEWGHDALKHEAHDGLLVMIWLVSLSWSGLRLCHGLACVSVMLSADIDEAHGLPLGHDLACLSADIFSNSTSQRGHAVHDGMGA